LTDQNGFPRGKVSFLGLVASASSVSTCTRIAAGIAAVAATGVTAAATEAATETTAAGEQAANSGQQAANATGNSSADARATAARVTTDVAARVAVAAARSAADGYRNLLFNAAGNAYGAGIRNLRANSLAAGYRLHLRHLTADSVRNLAGPGFAFPAGGANRNLLAAGLANPAGHAARHVLGAVFANPTSHAVVNRLRFANPLGNAVIDSLGARFANPAANANRNLLANRFATVLGASNLAFFTGRNPNLTADGPVRSLAANSVEVTAAVSPATSARVKAEAAPVPNQLAVAAARDDFLPGFPVTATDHHGLGFGVGNADRLAHVPHLSLSDPTANVVRHFPALHFANRPANGVLLNPVSGLTNSPGHRNLLLFRNSRPDVARPGDFLLFPNDPALSPHHGVTAIGITSGRTTSSSTNSTVAGAATTLGPAEAGRQNRNHGCSSQQTSYDFHFNSPKKI